MAKSPIKPSDAKAWNSCIRRVWLDNKGKFHQGSPEGFEKLIIDKGLAHEQAVLKRLQKTKDVHKAESVEHTTQLMNKGVEVIYQAQLLDLDENIFGFPDFLIRHESGEYQPADAKLSLSEDKKEIQIQLGLYRKLLGTSLPAIVYLGDGSLAEIGDGANSITLEFLTEMREILSQDEEPSVRYSHSKCRECSYFNHCRPKFIKKEDLSLLYGVDGRAVPHLEDLGISSITDLATSDAIKIQDIPYLKGKKKKERAILQAKSCLDGKIYITGDVKIPGGQWIHFDIEDNPLTETGNKHVYLWGFLIPDYGKGSFEYVWSDNERQDKDGWLGFIAKIEEYRQRYSSLILAHYSQHERSTIKSYAKRYSMEDYETVRYLLSHDGPLFDLQKPVTDNFVLPLQSYGLKDICKHPDLVNFQWEDEDSGSQWSVVQFHNFLNEVDHSKREALKKDILGYNCDDVFATRELEKWLRKKCK